MDRYKLPHPCRITAIRQENSFTRTFVFEAELTARPGQFVMAWLPDRGEKPFSLAGANPVSLTIAAVGPFSRAAHRLRVGDRLWLRGPLGRGFALPPEPERRILLVGGGYGAAPLHFLARQALAAGCRVETVIGARSKDRLLLVEAFKQLEITPRLTTEDGSRGQAGLVPEAMAAIFAGATGLPDRIYACGPTAMLEAVADICRSRGVPFQGAWEAYMRCALGLCGSCEVGEGWLTCLDGPVFAFNPNTIPPAEALPSYAW